MSAPLGTIPPPDPRKALHRQRDSARRASNAALALLLGGGQAMLAAALGYWAASAWPDPTDSLVSQAAGGMLLVLFAAHAVGYGALVLVGGVVLLGRLPRLFRPVRAPPASPRRGEHLRDRRAMVAIVGMHGAVLVAGALLLCLLLALGSGRADGGAWWRFLLAALALVPITAALLRAWSRSDL